MALNIKDEETDRLAREVARLAGEGLTEAVRKALEERKRQLVARRGKRTLLDELNEISLRCAALPDLDTRSADEILGYNEDGHFD